MQFPNAYKGVSRIYLAEILALIGALVVMLGSVMALGGAAAAAGGSADVGGGLVIGGAVVALGGVVLPVIGYILQLMGLSRASKDEPHNFKIAFIGAIVALLASVLSGLFVSTAWLYNLCNVIAGIANLVVFVYTIGGIMQLARELNRPNMVSLGNKILWMVLIAYIISFVVRILPIPELAVVLTVASGVLAIITYIVFLVYLSKAKKMLVV